MKIPQFKNQKATCVKYCLNEKQQQLRSCTKTRIRFGWTLGRTILSEIYCNRCHGIHYQRAEGSLETKSNLGRSIWSSNLIWTHQDSRPRRIEHVLHVLILQLADNLMDFLELILRKWRLNISKHYIRRDEFKLVQEYTICMKLKWSSISVSNCIGGPKCSMIKTICSL